MYPMVEDRTHNPLQNGATFSQRPRNMHGDFVGVASLTGPGEHSNLGSFQSAVAQRINTVQNDSIANNGTPGVKVGGRPDYVPAVTGLYNGLGAANDADPRRIPALSPMSSFTASADMYTKPFMPLGSVFSGFRPVMHTNKPVRQQRAANKTISLKFPLDGTAYADTTFTSTDRMKRLLPDETFPVFAYTGKFIGAQPFGKHITLLTLPTVNREFLRAATDPDGPANFQHEHFGDAFRNPKKFMENFRFFGYVLEIKHLNGIRESTEIMVTVATGCLRVTNLWLPCLTAPTNSTYCVLQFQLNEIATRNVHTGTPPTDRTRWRLSEGDNFPSKAVREGRAVALYSLVPQVFQNFAVNQPFHKDARAEGRSLPCIKIGRVFDSQEVDTVHIHRWDRIVQDSFRPDNTSTDLKQIERAPKIGLYVETVSRFN